MRPVMELTLACDHRILYGADAAAFLARIRELLEQPSRSRSERGQPKRLAAVDARWATRVGVAARRRGGCWSVSTNRHSARRVGRPARRCGKVRRRLAWCRPAPSPAAYAGSCARTKRRDGPHLRRAGRSSADDRAAVGEAAATRPPRAHEAASAVPA